MKRSEGALGGRLLARVGLALSLIGSIGGIAFQKYLYAAEVPDGYERLEWRVLNPADQGRVPPQIANLDGRKVYVRGFMYPQERTSGLRSFLLCQDNGVCCFGGQPAPSDNISVVFAEGPGVEYRQSSVAIAGTLRVYPPDPGIRVPMFVPVGPRGLVFVPPRAGRPFPLFVLDGELFR